MGRMTSYSLRPPYKLWAALIVAMGAASWLGYQGWAQRAVLDAQRAEIAAARSAAGELELAQRKLGQSENALGECKTALEQHSSRCGEAEASVDAMRADLNATRAELDELRKQRAEAAKRLAAFNDMTDKFQKMIEAGRLKVGVHNGRMTVQLPASALFQPGSIALSRDGELALMEVAVVLRYFNDRQFMVVGHTDDRPPEPTDATARFTDNWELSTARAVAVVGFLVEAKMRPENLIAAGAGPFDPVADNKTPKGRQQNHRIEIIVLPDLGDAPAPEEAAPQPAPAPAEP
jgi:chemotaxis protein MotB